jgi:hypothetical protein
MVMLARMPISFSTDPEASNTGYMRATRNTPAATMVAAWIRADTGVGPAMASGSQVWSGNWPDLPMAPQNSRAAPRVTVVLEISPVSTPSMIRSISKLRAAQANTKIPAMNPRSPTLVVRKALIAALALATSSQ